MRIIANRSKRAWCYARWFAVPHQLRHRLRRSRRAGLRRAARAGSGVSQAHDEAGGCAGPYFRLRRIYPRVRV